MKGILLVGGGGTRLYPSTMAISKQLLPVYDKPIVYYSLSTLMLAGAREILIITNPQYIEMYRSLLGNGIQFGIRIDYEVQNYPRGIAEAIQIGSKFIGRDSFVLALGDNLFHGTDLGTHLTTFQDTAGATIFGYWVSNPNDYGVVEFNEDGDVVAILEKPEKSLSNYAIPGLYFFDNKAISYACEVEPSHRGELEITSVINRYLEARTLKVSILPRGVMWLDTGTPNGLHDASTYVRIIEERQGLKINCPEEVAWRQGWISTEEIRHLSKSYPDGPYSAYLLSILDRK
jgi:glucose-1-phosphate thymidylyltransferase